MRKTSRHALVLAAALALAGCFRPLYGPPEVGALAVQDTLRNVQIELQGERLAHYLRNELEFQLRGGAPEAGPRTHRLAIVAGQSTQASIVDRLTGAAESAQMQVVATYSLFRIGQAAPLTGGEARVVVSYDRGQQRFAAIRAARDAEIQGARQMAEQIRTRVAAFLADAR